MAAKMPLGIRLPAGIEAKGIPRTLSSQYEFCGMS